MARSRLVVLVVEDEAIVRMAISDHLTDEGFEVLEAADAKQAISLLSRYREIRPLFTDIDMPGGMDGLKLAAAVRERWPPIKIVVTSGHRRVSVEELPVDAQFVPKPYSPDAVADAFRKVLH